MCIGRKSCEPRPQEQSLFIEAGMATGPQYSCVGRWTVATTFSSEIPEHKIRYSASAGGLDSLEVWTCGVMECGPDIGIQSSTLYS